MEKLSLIDVSLEDDLLISSPENCDGRNCSMQDPANASEGENLVNMSKQWDHRPEISESPEQKRVKSGKVNLRKSLAWDSAFFSSEGVLNTEELAIMNSTFRETEACSLPGIQEDLRKSTESTSTLDIESYTVENLGGDLFNLRASIQMSVSKHDNCFMGERNTSQIGSRKKDELPCQTKTKPPITLKSDGVSKQRLECTSKEAVIGGKETAKGSESSKLLLKPPRVVHKPTSLLTVPSNKDSSGSGEMKNNARRISAGNGANRQGIVAFSKTTGDSRGMTSRSISLPKPTPHLNTTVFSSNNRPISSLSNSVKSPQENSRKRSALRNSNQSLSGTTPRTPIRTSKSNFGPSNFKFSSKASPSSSIDSFVSEGSSSTSTSIKPRNSVESLSSTTSSSPSIVSIDQPCIKKDISSNRLLSQPTAKASIGPRVFSEPSNRDHATRSSINSSTGSKSFKPSGLRMPSPKIGYFDAEKTLASKNPNNFSKIGQRSSLVKGGVGTNDNVATNKQKSSRIPSLRPAAQTPSAVLPHATKAVSPPQVHTNSSPVNAQAANGFDNEEKHGELCHAGHIADKLNSVSDKIQKENMLPSYETNGSGQQLPSGGQKISEVDIMDEKMSSLSLSETTEFVVGD